MIDVLLLNPPTPSPAEQSWYGETAPPLGLLYVAAALRNAGFAVSVVDLSLAAEPVEALKSALSELEPRVVGFNAVTQNFSVTQFLGRWVKRLAPDAVLWVGGPHVSYEFEAALDAGFEVVFLFEAEESAVEAANVQIRHRGDLRSVAGIAFREDGETVRTKARPRQTDLDRIAFPARDLLPMHSYRRPGTIMSSRGCPVKCIFCIASTFEDAYRYRSAENTVDELVQMYETYGINDFYFIDNVFTTHRKRAREICQRIRDAQLPIGFYCVSRVDFVSQRMMQELASAGCYRIELGVESADLGVIETIRKKIKIDQVRRAADLILNLGMQPMFTFQVGHPSDTLASIEATLKLSEELRSIGAGTYLAITTPYPGTPLLNERESFGVHMETWDWEDFRMSNPTYSTTAFSRNDLRRALFREAASQMATAAAGLAADPPSAPWIRFAASNGSKLPPPPDEGRSDLELEPLAPGSLQIA